MSPKNRTFLVYGIGITILAGVGAILWFTFPLTKKDVPDRIHETSLTYAGPLSTEPIKPIPPQEALDKDKVALGKRLFNDPQLSRNNTISCTSCHILAGTGAGADQRFRSLGIDGAVGDVNTPTVFNSVFNFKQFWDGRADTLDDQLDGPIEHPKEMGSSFAEIISKLEKDPTYVTAFKKKYTDGLNATNIKDAIATFESSLITPNSRFDRYLLGDAEALTAEELAGYKLFKEIGCVVCHQGVNVGGNMFQTFGKFGNYFEDRGNITKQDYGRFNVTGQESDRFKFKVPGLRNVEKTSPYFHDGNAESLEKAVQVMVRYQLGREISPEDLGRIVSFLKTLTGEYRDDSARS